MFTSLILFAQEVEDKAIKDAAPGGFLSNPVLPMLVIMVVFFFLIILPSQRRQKKERESILTNLKKNDEVVTSAGIIGIVSLIKDNADEVTLKIDDNARIRVLKSSIVRIVKKEEAKDAAANASNTSVKPAN
jgi:preprotein translocase subunit YajC